MDAALRRRLFRACREAEGYLELGMPREGLRSLQQHQTLVHADARGCYLMGECLRELKRYQEATIPLRRSLALIPDDTHVAIALAWCLKRLGRLEQAIETLEDALHIEPGTAIIHYNLACYWSLARNRRHALQHLARALEIDGNYVDFVRDEPDFDPLRHDPQFQQLVGLGGIES